MAPKALQKRTIGNISTDDGTGNVIDILTRSKLSKGTSSEYYNNNESDDLTEDHDGNNKEEFIDSMMPGGANMDNNDILSKYIDKVDRDQSELKTDMREREARISDKISATEERMDNRLNRIEDNISQYTRSVHEEIKGLNTKIDNRISALESKIDGNNKYIISIAVTTILGIAALVVAFLVK